MATNILAKTLPVQAAGEVLPEHNRTHPISAPNQTEAQSPAAGQLHFANPQGKGTEYRVTLEGDGVTTTWNSTEVAELVNLDGAAATLPDLLGTVVIVNKTNVLKRVTAAPGAGEFQVTAADGGTIILGSVYALGTNIDVLMGNEFGTTTLVANHATQVVAGEFEAATVAIINRTALGC